jgi:hypothetical protein
MNTTINNDLRVFQVVSTGWTNRKYFCNLEQLQDCVKQLNDNEPYIINHFWNNKPKKASRKFIADMLKANNLSFDWVK